MKSLITLALFTLSLVAFAESSSIVFPRVFTYPSQVQVHVYNNTIQDVWCTGSIYSRKQSGATQIDYYSERVYRGMSSFRTFQNRTFNDRFISSHHSIFCH